MEIGGKFGLVLVTLGGLNLFSWLYDRLVTGLEDRGYDEGFTSLLVVGGVLWTLLGIAVLRAVVLAGGVVIASQDVAVAVVFAFALDFAAFAASGFWMVWGSWRRYAARRRNGQENHRRNGNGA